MSGPLKAAWGLTAFVILAGVVGWILSGQAVFAVFLVLGVLTGVGAAFVLRTIPPAGRSAGPEERT